MRSKFLTPAAPAAGFVCRTLRIPDGEEFLAAVNGALLELAQPWNWEQFGALTPAETAELFFTMYEDYRESRGCVIGTIFAHANTVAPAGSLACDGASHLKADYPSLYDALDSVFIIDGSTFRTPDLRGRSPIGAGQGSGLTNRAVDASGGAESHTLTEAQMPSHNHVITGPALNPLLVGAIPNFSQSGLATATGFTGGGVAHNNMHPFRALNYAIWAR